MLQKRCLTLRVGGSKGTWMAQLVKLALSLSFYNEREKKKREKMG